MSSSYILFAYRLLFLYIEPLAAFFGCLITLFDPTKFFLSISPEATSLAISPLVQGICGQLAGHLLLFAWIQGVLLRSTTDLKVWKIVLAGIVLCDILHLWGSYKSLGFASFINPRLWRAEEWVNLGMLYGPGSMRIAFCLGVGFDERIKSS